MPTINHKLYKWEEPSIIGERKEAGHAIAFTSDDPVAACMMTNLKRKYSLSGEWKFYYGKGVELPENFKEKDLDDTQWDIITVPGVWQLKGYGMPYYYSSSYPQAIDTNKKKIPHISHELQEFGIYRRTFEIPAHFKGQEIFLHFGAAKAALEVYVNGVYVGYSQGSMTPHEFDVTEYVTEGQNQITALVWRYSDGTYLEDQDMWFFSGIYREVYLYAEPVTTVRDFYMKAELDQELRNAHTVLKIYLKHFDRNKRDGGKKETQSGQIRVKASIPARGEVLGEIKLELHDSEQKEIVFQHFVCDPDKWSHEAPNLYTILIEWEADGKTYYKAFRFGFRKVGIDGNVLMLNGKRLIVRGVNRHDYDPDHGWAVPKERYLQDIKILKKLNVNAVRTSHYPNDPYFYDLCDEYGILVMDEAEIESHGVRRILPTDDERWTKACVDRVERMILRDRNHPAVVFWSLGNEAGCGENFVKMRRAAEKLDTTRVFHYEGMYDRRCTDLLSRMYPNADEFQKLCEKKPLKNRAAFISNSLAADVKDIESSMYDSMPVILCEYAHCMGNSLGNFKEYTDAFENYPHMCGGFIWDYVDQAIHKKVDGTDQWLYGSDFNEDYSPYGFRKKNAKGNDGEFCANGIVSADRMLHPAAYEVKKCYQPLSVLAEDVREGQYRICNKQLFSGLENYDLYWEIKEDGKVLDHGKIDRSILDTVGPQETRTIRIDSQIKNPETLTFRWMLTEDCKWTKKGTVVAYDQFFTGKLDCAPCKMERKANEKVSITVEKQEIRILAADMIYKMENGLISSAQICGKELFLKPMKLNFSRVLTDNDIDAAHFVPMLMNSMTGKKWELSSEKMKYTNFELDTNEKDHVRIKTFWKHPICKELTAEYHFCGDGTVEVLVYSVSKKMDMVRVGVTLTLPVAFDQLSWYGRGPWECYPDRKTAAVFDRYSMCVNEVEHRYMRPQENGTRCDVKEIEVSDNSGRVLSVHSMQKEGLLFSAWHYTGDTLANAAHSYQLCEEDLTTLNIDGVMCGVGGDLPGMLSLHEKYRLRAKKGYEAHFRINFRQEHL